MVDNLLGPQPTYLPDRPEPQAALDGGADAIEVVKSWPDFSEGWAALAAVTVVGRHLTYVDAYATAAFAMGDRAQSWLEGLPGYWAFGVTADGASWRTSGFAEPAITPSATSRR